MIWDTFILQFKTLAAVQMQLSSDTQALNTDFLLESNNVWHLFLTIYRAEMNIYPEKNLSFSGKHLNLSKVLSFSDLLSRGADVF